MAGPAQLSIHPGRLDLERKAFLDLLRMANTLATPEAIARQLLVLAQHLSGCEAVAIRLKSGPGYPYVATLGFGEAFVASETDLCATDARGHLLRDARHQPILACLCGKVLSGTLQADLPGTTPRGSFITPSARAWAAGKAMVQVPGLAHSRCCAEGFETIGLFPIRRDAVTYGLIQCNDPRPRRLTPQSIDLMENLAASAAHLFQLAMA